MPVIDPRILLSGRGIQLPDPMERAGRMISLAQLTDESFLRRMQIQQAQDAQRTQQALNAALPIAVQGGFSPDAIQTAVRANPAAAQGLLKYADERRKAQADLAKSEAETRFKDIEAKLKVADRLGNEAQWLSDHPNLQPEMVANFMKKVAANGLENIITPIPMQAWTDPVKAREALRAAGSLFYDIKDRVSQTETGRHNRATESNQAGTLAETTRYHNADLGQRMTIANMQDARARDLNAASREANQDNRLNSQTQGVAKLVESQGLPGLVASVRTVNDTLNKYATSDLPGVGATGMIPQFLLSEGGKQVRSQIQGVANDLLKLYSGGAVTLNEAERRAAEMMSSRGFSDQDLYNAWPLIVGRVNNALGNVRASAPPEAIKTYQNRGGMRIDPIAPATRTSGTETDKLPDPATLPDGAVIIDNSSGKRMTVRGGKYMLQ